MTQQQIGYINAMTARENLAISREQAVAASKQAEASYKQAEASLMQAQTAERRRSNEQGWQYFANAATGLASTVGGIIVAALL